jgi:(p)ppGpp synthase/HD superfamily hydrolase
MPKASRTKPNDRTTLPLWQEAAAFAARAHRHQLRKDGKTPYISHAVRVALTVTQVFGSDDQIALVAALLHDTIEDTTTDYDDLNERFGSDVADCVAALTKNMALPEHEREREYDHRLAKAAWQTRLVKLADTYDNFCDLETWPSDKQATKKREAYEKCLRAIALAKNDTNPAIRKAVNAVSTLIKPYERQRP